MNETFTPGPWRIQPDEDKDGFPIYRIMFDHSNICAGLIATVEGQRVPVKDGLRKTPGGEPNARLIAAAPELVGLVREYAWGSPSWKTDDRADALLAKIYGDD